MGEKEIKKRIILAIIESIMGIFLLAFLLIFQLSRWWRLLTFPFWLISLVTIISVKKKTCVKLSFQNKKCENGKQCTINDLFLAQAMKKRAIYIMITSIVIAILITGLLLIIPVDW